MTLRSIGRRQLERGFQLLAVVRLRDSDRRSEIGGLHEHRELEGRADASTSFNSLPDTTTYSTTGRPRSLARRFITSLSIETDDASTPAPT